MYHMNADDLFIGGTYIMINGIIIQRNQIGRYKGVEGDNWYLNDKYPELFEEYFCENIEKSWYYFVKLKKKNLIFKIWYGILGL